VALQLRCVGRGETQGRLRLVPPNGITVEPALVDLGRLSDGDEKVARLRVKAAADAANALHTVRVEPDGQTPAAAGSLPVSVGVVMTEDHRVPLTAQTVVRAPGYTMKIDHQSAVSCYLLDADGHRRHGHVNESSLSYLGTGAVERDGQWTFRYRTPCRFIFPGKNTLVAVSGSGGGQVRLRYTFHEDQVVLALVPPTNPTLEYALWFGDFDALGQPRHNGKEAPKGVKNAAATADWFFFPHPVRRQGMLLIPPPKTPLRYGGTAFNVRLRAGQEVVLRFATEDELPGLLKQKGLSPARSK
jgi:hypothetical protein